MGGHIIGVRISQTFIRTEKLSPISSEWHLAEQQIAVPDLLPTQGDNLLDAKILQKNEMSKEKLESSRSMGIISPCDLSHHRTCRSAYGGSIINNTPLPY